jgi:hypothetical protein
VVAINGLGGFAGQINGAALEIKKTLLDYKGQFHE